MLRSHRSLSIARRRFLQAMGLTAGGLFLPSMQPNLARAEDGPPLRVVFCWFPQGVFHDLWRMRIGDLPEDPRVGFEFSLADLAPEDFSRSLAPLHPLRDRALIIEGLALLTAECDPVGNAHSRASVTNMTGNHGRSTGSNVEPSSASVDQIIGAYLREQDPTLTDFVTLEYQVGNDTFRNDGHPLAALDAAGEPYAVPWVNSPVQAFQSLFPSEGQGPDDGGLQRRVDVLDAVEAEYQSMAPKLGSEDRDKLELHRDMVRDLQARIETLANLECTVPTIESGDGWEYKRDAFSDLIVASMSCRLTRVASLFLTPASVELFGGAGNYHTDYVHGATSAPLQRQEVMADVVAYFYDAMARLAQKLDAVPEGNGTMLDHTVIVGISENGFSHDHDQWTAVLLGGAAGHFDMGRYIRYPENVPRPGRLNGDRFMGQPHNRLLVSLAQAMGVPTQQVGLAQVMGNFADGSSVPIDLTGPLEGLS